MRAPHVLLFFVMFVTVAFFHFRFLNSVFSPMLQINVKFASISLHASSGVSATLHVHSSFSSNHRACSMFM